MGEIVKILHFLRQKKNFFHIDQRNGLYRCESSTLFFI